MMRRPLGRSGISIAPLMLGGNVFGWLADREATFAILDRFVDAGLNAIDTADIYSGWVEGHQGGESETLIGEWLSLRGGRERVVIASKVGGALAPVNGKWDTTLSAEHIVGSVENSLRRLQTDYIDLYQAHGDDPRTPLEESLEAFERLIQAGKVRAIGASHFSRERLETALQLSAESGLHGFQTIQPRYNLCAREEVEAELQAACLRHQVGVLGYSPLAKGFLTGKYRSEADVAGKTYVDFLRPHLHPQGVRILDTLAIIAADHASTSAAVAIAWVMAQPAVTAAIAAVDTPEQLEEMLGAVELQLSELELYALSAVSAKPPQSPAH
jgi:aryl-alcohol dehydrogenase-like predicted oxidoreductase